VTTVLAERLATLPAMDVAGRVERLRALFAEEVVDGLLVTCLTNVRYLTGFTGSAGVVVVSPEELVLVTDGRYREQAAEQMTASGVAARLEITGTEQRRIVTEALGGASRIGLEADHVTWAAQRRYAGEWFTATDLVPTSGLVEQLRRTKDDGELARMEAAAAVADAALAELRPWLLTGPTEAEFAFELDATMRRLGAAKPSFETIVASGPNGARPHARPSGRRVTDGDLVVLDFGAVVDGYCSDMTRTVAVGAVDETSQRMFEVVTAAQAAGVAAVRAGVDAADVDAACREVIAEAGWAEAFTHGTGHGVGLDIHEAPRVGTTSDATLAVGDVVTVEPGVYLPAHGGVRVEDTVVVTPEGCRPLTHSTKDPAP
jgi:Xaa-Pro aminopeptidase